jgi:hypothetical protein
MIGCWWTVEVRQIKHGGNRQGENPGLSPEFVGIVEVDASKLTVKRPATEGYPGLGMKSGEMAKELLMRVLRS